VIAGDKPFIETAQALFRRSRYTDLAAALQRSEPAGELPIECALLVATALTRTGHAQQALERLRTIGLRRDCSVRSAIRTHLLEGVAEFALGQAERPLHCIEQALGMLSLVDDPEALFEIRLHQAFHAWTERDIARAEMLARAAMASSDGAIYAAAAQIVGFAAAHRGRYLEQLAILEDTLAHLDRLRHEDLWLEASLMQNIAGVVADFHLPAVARRLAERTETLDWPHETAVALYHIFRALAYSRLFGSDALSALDYLERAENIVPNEGWKLVARLDRVLLTGAFIGRQPAGAIDNVAEIRQAEKIADEIDWAQIRGEERLGLLMLAEVLAGERPRDAARYLSTYRATKHAMSPSLLGRFDARWTALEDFVEGLIAAANGADERAVELFGQAFGFWKSVGYAWRAARAALKLYELTGERRHLEWAAREARAYPFSWIGDAVKRAGRRRIG
jgi:tetratricopeptide (TPR) repeat protein